MKLNIIKYLFLVSILSNIFISCEENDSEDFKMTNVNYVSFEPGRTIYVNTGSDAQTIDVTVYASKPFDVDKTIMLYVDTDGATIDGDEASTLSPANYSVPSSFVFPAGETQATFQISNVLAQGVGKTIIIGFVQQEGIDFATTYSTQTDPDDPTQTLYNVKTREVKITVSESCDQNPLRIEIHTDQWGSETSWELYDSALNLVASGGPYDDKPATGVYLQDKIDLCLPSGDYTFIAYDAYGDGMDSGYGNGYYRLVTMDNVYVNEVNEIAKNGLFSNDDLVQFTLP